MTTLGVWRHSPTASKPIVGDIADRGDVDRLFDGLSGTVDVIHTAGVIHPTTMAEFDAVNHVGTDNVLRAAEACGRPTHGARVVEQPVRHQPRSP